MYSGKYDFSGWATKNDLECSDGLIIRRGAFRVNDGKKVPLVWGHKHDSPSAVIGHAILENREDGVFAYCSLNNTPSGKDAKEIVSHGDVVSLSIWANNLDRSGKDVLHGVIREVSLVIAGANPGAFIESVVCHNEPIDELDDEGIFYTGEGIELYHSENPKEDEKEDKKDTSEDSDETIGDIYESMTEKQKEAVAVIVGMALEEEDSRDDEEKVEEEEETEMKHNLFDGSDRKTDYLSHEEQVEIVKDIKRYGSLKESIRQHLGDGEVVHISKDRSGNYIAHSVDTTGMEKGTGTNTYGLRDPDFLFPDFRMINNQPGWISRNMGWVDKVLSTVHRTPFARVKTMFADITEDDARARGYIKGKIKKEEFFTLIKRTTSAKTIYKKQKMDRDDLIDMNPGFDVIAWIRGEMRMMLNEEIARAILIGDGRATSSDDHINEENIRPIAKDVPLFNTIVKITVPAAATNSDIAKVLIDSVIRSRKDYKGTGSPTLYTTEDWVTEMLLLEDKIGHKLYKSESELSTALRISDFATVEVMNDQKISVKEGETTKQYPLIGIAVNMVDYNVGADKGGEINSFDDFDIDHNQQIYLLETRISGALVKPYSALTFVLDRQAASGASVSETK